MPKTLEEIRNTKAGSAEESPRYNEGGWYKLTRDDGTTDEILAITHPKFGTAQADAYIRVGYVFDRPATDEDLLGVPFVDDRQTHSTGALNQPGVTRAEFDALQAKLDSLEREKAATEPVVSPSNANKI